MRITDMKIQVLEPEGFTFQWREDIPPIQNSMSVLRLETDEGITGVSTAWLPAAPREIAETAIHYFKPLIVGADAHDRERLWQEMMRMVRYLIPPKAASMIDIALWDIAGKQAGLPIYQLLGAYRHEIPAYATTEVFADDQGFIDATLTIRDTGYHACKLHGYTDPDKDIRLIAAVREAVGPDYRMMFDATSGYDFQDALRVGRALEQHGYYWYEDPVRDDDVAGNRHLARELDIPVLMGESTSRGIWPYANFLREESADALRVVGDLVGGITGMRKIDALAEAHGRRAEPHSYGSTLVQAAHLHHMLASSNCEYFEMPYPEGPLGFGMKDHIEMSKDGIVSAPTAPGLGYEVDWDVVDDATVAEY